MTSKRAICPLCQRSTPTFTHEGRRFYIHHHTTRGHAEDNAVCEGTGWLVEDDELVTTTRRNQ